MDYLTPQYLRLGASLYVPADRKDVTAVANAEKLAHARSVIFCTEDSVREDNLPVAMKNLEHMLARIDAPSDRMRFIRARNPEVLGQLLQMDGISKIDGFVLPKVTNANLSDYTSKFGHAASALSQFQLMPTLETSEVFDVAAMRMLCEQLSAPEIRSSILSLRIGGNDLLNLLGIRRSRHRTIYDSPLGVVIASLVTVFKPAGFNLTSPVCEFLYDHEILDKELLCDAEHGLFGKTAIHPDQIARIENAYKPSEQEVEMAEAIVRPDAPAVFNMHGTMCEVATHLRWAQHVLARAKIYGTYGRREHLQRVA